MVEPVNRDSIQVVFLGATGNGKSTLCNDLVGGQKFQAQANIGGGGISQVFTKQEITKDGKLFGVIDSPGVGDSTLDIRSAIDTLYESVGGSNQISAIVLVVKASDVRFEAAARVAMSFAQAFFLNIDSKRFWLAVTWAQTFDDDKEALQFAKEKKEGIRKEFKIDIPEENTIFAFNKAKQGAWVADFVKKIQPGTAGVLNDKAKALTAFTTNIGEKAQNDQVFAAFIQQNAKLTEGLFSMMTEMVKSQNQANIESRKQMQKLIDQQAQNKKPEGCFSGDVAVIRCTSDGKIRDLQEGQFILTYDQRKDSVIKTEIVVIDRTLSKSSLMELKFGNGEKLTLTPSHFVFVVRGMSEKLHIPAYELKRGDRLIKIQMDREKSDQHHRAEESLITDITLVKEDEVFNVLTFDYTLIANGVFASSSCLGDGGAPVYYVAYTFYKIHHRLPKQLFYAFKFIKAKTGIFSSQKSQQYRNKVSLGELKFE